MIAGDRHLLAALFHRGQVLDEDERQGVGRAEHCELPLELLPGRGAPAAIGRIADVDASFAHRGHFCRQVIALDDDVTDAAARRDEFRQRVGPTTGAARLVLGRIVDRQQLQVIVPVERDRVVCAFSGMRAAGIDVEAQLVVLLDAAREVGDADHHVVDTGKHALAHLLQFLQ
jgi:hypothetical protein